MDLVTGVSNTQAFEINNGILLAKPGSLFTQHLIKKLCESIVKQKKLLEAKRLKDQQLIVMLTMLDPAKAE